MQQAVDFLMSHLVLVFVLVFLMFLGGAGIQISQISNYSHEANEIISRYGGLSKDAAQKLKDVSDQQYHGRFIVTNIKKVNGKLVMPQLKDGMDYSQSNDLRHQLQMRKMTPTVLSKRMAKKVFKQPDIEFNPKDNMNYNQLQASTSMPPELAKVISLRKNETRLEKESYKVNNAKLYSQMEDKIKDDKKQLDDLQDRAISALTDYEYAEIQEILHNRDKSGNNYPLGLEWRDAVAKIIGSSQEDIFNTDTVGYGKEFSYVLWTRLNVMNMKNNLPPRTYTITNDSRQGTIGGAYHGDDNSTEKDNTTVLNYR